MDTKNTKFLLSANFDKEICENRGYHHNNLEPLREQLLTLDPKLVQKCDADAK